MSGDVQTKPVPIITNSHFMLGLAYGFKKYFSFLPDGTTCHAWPCWNDERCWPRKPTWVSWTDALYGSAASYGKLYVALFNLINVCITCCSVLFNWVCNWDSMLCDKRKLASSSLCHEKDLYFTQSELIHFRRCGCHVKITWKLITGMKTHNMIAFNWKLVFFASWASSSHASYSVVILNCTSAWI